MYSALLIWLIAFGVFLWLNYRGGANKKWTIRKDAVVKESNDWSEVDKLYERAEKRRIANHGIYGDSPP